MGIVKSIQSIGPKRIVARADVERLLLRALLFKREFGALRKTDCWILWDIVKLVGRSLLVYSRGIIGEPCRVQAIRNPKRNHNTSLPTLAFQFRAGQVWGI
jgi:hypothetical protein